MQERGYFLQSPRNGVPNTYAHHISEALPVSCFQGQVSSAGACCRCAVAVMTASL